MGRVLFVSCTNVGISMIEEIFSNSSIKVEVVGIVNLNFNEGINKANYQTYVEVSDKYNIPIHYCKNINDSDTVLWMKEKKPDIIIQSGWSQKFSSDVLNIPKYMCIGEHPAPLPKGRGAACVNWAILTGETSWGDSFFEMVSEYDKGKLLAQDFFNIEVFDNVKTVYDKVAEASKNIITKNVEKWSNGIFCAVEQDESKATYYKKRCPSDGFFTFDEYAKKLHNFIRAQTYPYPCAFFMANGKKIKVISSNEIFEKTNEKPGTVLKSTERGGIIVVCKNYETIEILRLREENQPEMWAKDWAEKNNIKNLS